MAILDLHHAIVRFVNLRLMLVPLRFVQAIDGCPACATVTAMPSPKYPQKKAPHAKKAPNALAKPVRPDPSLAAIVDPEPLPRTELTKRVWA